MNSSLNSLAGRNAVIYGGSGAIGSAVAHAFARAGARVVLVARNAAKLDAVVRAIVAEGGDAEAAAFDALDEHAIDAHADALVARHGRIDIALNAVGILHVQGTPLAELSLDEYATPLHAFARTNFLTARAVARHMVRQRSGVILTISTIGSRLSGAGFLGYAAACATIEALSRCLAGELGVHGVRTVCLRGDAITDALERGSYTNQVFAKLAAAHGMTPKALLDDAARTRSLLGRLPTLAQFAAAAQFAASDAAGAMTGAILNLSCGSVLDA